MNPIIAPIVRRAILDLLFDIGLEQNDEVLAKLLGQLGHRAARREVAAQLGWLADAGLIKTEQLGGYVVARILADGRDVSEGRLAVEGVSRFRTGD